MIYQKQSFITFRKLFKIKKKKTNNHLIIGDFNINLLTQYEISREFLNSLLQMVSFQVFIQLLEYLII